MKQISLILIAFFTLLSVQSCKDEPTPEPTPAATDLRDKIVGVFTTKLTVYNAKTGVKKKSYDLELKVQKSSKGANKTEFYLDGLYLFMTAENLREISVGLAMDFPEQEVKDFGTLKGKNYLNVNGTSERFAGINYSADDKFTIYLEKDNGGTSDNDLYEFFLTRQ